MKALDLAILALAAWRLSYMLAWEDGPGQVFSRLRRLAGVSAIEDGKPTPFWGKVISCPLCSSVYVAVALYLAYSLPWAPQATGILAVSGIASIAYLAVKR